MANPKTYFLKEVGVCMVRQYLRESGRKPCWWYGSTLGIAKVTTENISTDFEFVLILSEKETGKMFVELSPVHQTPLKDLVADDAAFQIILEMQGRHFSTDWLCMETNFVALKQEILHDLILDRPGSGNKFEVKVSVVAGLKPKNPFQINKKILEEAIGSNFVIVSSSGTEIKCHKSFLSAHSDVLRAMIEGSLTEALTSRMEMVDMSDEAVKAFLAFLYYWDITEASNNCGIAFELLHAAHKYNITSLETEMRDLFLKNEVSWLSVDVAVKLFAFCRNLVDGKELKMKGVQVLKAKAHSLEKSECLNDLFERDPEAAKDLFMCCLVT